MSSPAFQVSDPGSPEGARVEFRCPVPFPFRDGSLRPGKLFFVMYAPGPVLAAPGAYIEIPCPACRRASHARPLRVLHRYALDGSLITTVEVPEGDHRAGQDQGRHQGRAEG